MKKYIEDLTVIKNTQLNSKHHLIEFKHPGQLPEMKPGQFVEAKIDGSEKTYLRRPFSIHRVDYSTQTMHLLVKVVGDGTNTLAHKKEGDIVNIMFPLGIGFNLTEKKEVLLIGGGCGIAPLFYLAQQLCENENNVTILIGSRTSDDILMAEDYKKFGKVYISTEDGSLGEKGMVTMHSLIRGKSKTISEYTDVTNNLQPKFDKIYCCGPDGMMRAIAHYAEQLNIPCEVSLENTMACGIGACLCCVVESTSGNITVCTEGPVFDSKRLKGWTKDTEVGCSIG